jgi:hypothetical protein
MTLTTPKIDHYVLAGISAANLKVELDNMSLAGYKFLQCVVVGTAYTIMGEKTIYVNV